MTASSPTSRSDQPAAESEAKQAFSGRNAVMRSKPLARRLSAVSASTVNSHSNAALTAKPMASALATWRASRRRGERSADGPVKSAM